MRYPTEIEVIALHERVMAQSGGAVGLRDLGALESAVAQPRMTFGGSDLYPTLVEKAAALGFSLIANHPFVDGNKRTGHAAMRLLLLAQGYRIAADVDAQEAIILAVAAGQLDRVGFTAWLQGVVAAG